MKNDVIRKKDPFPKTIGEASHLLSNGQITMAENTTMEKVTRTMVWPLQQ